MIRARVWTYLTEIAEGAWSLLAGMGITLRYFFSKPVTVIYPKERLPVTRFKGPIAFVSDEKTSDHRCIACNACIKVCPSRCMSLVAQKSAVDGKRVLTDFHVNYMLCSLCGLCIDVCPTDALKHDTPNYDMVALGHGQMEMDLLEPFRRAGTPSTRIPVAPAAPAAPKPSSPAPEAPRP